MRKELGGQGGHSESRGRRLCRDGGESGARHEAGKARQGRGVGGKGGARPHTLPHTCQPANAPAGPTPACVGKSINVCVPLPLPHLCYAVLCMQCPDCSVEEMQRQTVETLAVSKGGRMQLQVVETSRLASVLSSGCTARRGVGAWGLTASPGDGDAGLVRVTHSSALQPPLIEAYALFGRSAPPALVPRFPHPHSPCYCRPSLPPLQPVAPITPSFREGKFLPGIPPPLSPSVLRIAPPCLPPSSLRPAG